MNLYKPKDGDIVYYICGASDVSCGEWGGREKNLLQILMQENRVFKTKQLAEKALKEIIFILHNAKHD